MPWVSQFKLGRPTKEVLFDLNPFEMAPDYERYSADMRNLVGDLKERVFRTITPTVKLSSEWFPKTQLDKFVSLLTITDTFLSFITRDDWQMILEPNMALTTTTVKIQTSSITKLSAALVAAGGSASITINGVFDNADGTGTNYFTGGGSYNSSTRLVTLGTALASIQRVYITYTYTGWLVRMKRLSAPITGGRVDLFTYDFSLEGV